MTQNTYVRPSPKVLVRRPAAVLVLAGLVLAGGLVVLGAGWTPLALGDGYQPTTSPEATNGSEYAHTTVTVLDEDGTELGAVSAAVADTPSTRYTGLSKTAALPEDSGMLFAYESESTHTFVMREMAFGIDIVFVGADGVVTTIHHAPAPPPGTDGEEFRYEGRGQYVLEVNYDWTTRRGIEAGDRVDVGTIG